jgi:hypothetical protein
MIISNYDNFCTGSPLRCPPGRGETLLIIKLSNGHSNRPATCIELLTAPIQKEQCFARTVALAYEW